MPLLVLLIVFIISVCSLVYQLLAGTISSYLVGDSVYQFSLVIGLFVSSMGVGSFLSRYIENKLHDWFILVELLTGTVGGFSSVLLFFAFAKLDNYTPFLFMVSVAIGSLVGLELPLILRIVKESNLLKIVVSNIMTADYAGALIASIVFPIIFVPYFGLIRTGLFFGLMNVAVASIALRLFKDQLAQGKLLQNFAIISFTALITCFICSDKITTFTENSLYKDEIIYSAASPYQRVIVTRSANDIRMFINGSIQFSSLDEYRYHEPLILPAMSSAHSRKNILIIGGGDGMAAREVLKFKDVEQITLVDIDPAITGFSKTNPVMCELNKGSLKDPKMTVVNEDAWKFLEKDQQIYDVIVVDLPDPDDLTLSRLYSRTFYRLLAHKLSKGGKIVTQATSPVYSTLAFWCINNTMAAIENPLYHAETASETEHLYVKAYNSYVPSFGSWGFVMASNTPFDWNQIKIDVDSRYVTNDTINLMGIFPPDIDHEETKINTIDTHIVKQYYEEGWDKWSL